ncbi:hypothetical protein [Halotia branconii]|uniref:Uncharacterized protein n=1 Tax=Halotia branconii CENA392 TaxID=1539056 RepID=A0AAJ6NVS3_9CYAN|nr:hypothetical protein [Halotia branconii]WGV27655.1 hypothetical protein QI031_09295 [Halotia branconii CENA392]
MTLVGGTTSEFGIDLALGAVSEHNSNEDKTKSIRQRCIQLNKNIEDSIQHCEHLKYIADKSFANSGLMKYLSKKQRNNNFIQLVGNILFWLIFFVTISIFICSIILFFRAEFGFSLGAFLLAITTFVGVGTVANYISKNDEQWKRLLSEIAENEHYKYFS